MTTQSIRFIHWYWWWFVNTVLRSLNMILFLFSFSSLSHLPRKPCKSSTSPPSRISANWWLWKGWVRLYINLDFHQINLMATHDGKEHMCCLYWNYRWWDYDMTRPGLGLELWSWDKRNNHLGKVWDVFGRVWRAHDERCFTKAALNKVVTNSIVPGTLYL